MSPCSCCAVVAEDPLEWRQSNCINLTRMEVWTPTMKITLAPQNDSATGLTSLDVRTSRAFHLFSAWSHVVSRERIGKHRVEPLRSCGAPWQGGRKPSEWQRAGGGFWRPALGIRAALPTFEHQFQENGWHLRSKQFWDFLSLGFAWKSIIGQ